MNDCFHGLFMTREYPLNGDWIRIKVQCLVCVDEYAYWRDRSEQPQEALYQ